MYSAAARLAAEPIGRLPIWTHRRSTCSKVPSGIFFNDHSWLGQSLENLNEMGIDSQ
jgi:hypothetical protein